MEKLKLNLDDLKVETFETAPKEPELHKGTVLGHGGHTRPWQPTCDHPTCDDTADTDLDCYWSYDYGITCAGPGCP